MLNKLKLSNYLTSPKTNTTKGLEQALSSWKKKIPPSSPLNKNIESLLRNVESQSLTLKVPDRKINPLLRSIPSVSKKVKFIEQRHASSIDYYTTRVLASSESYDLPRAMKIRIIFPALSNLPSELDGQVKLATVGRTFLEMCGWSYCMKHFRPRTRPIPGSLVNGYNFDLLGYVSPFEEIAQSEVEYVRYAESREGVAAAAAAAAAKTATVTGNEVSSLLPPLRSSSSSSNETSFHTNFTSSDHNEIYNNNDNNTNNQNVKINKPYGKGYTRRDESNICRPENIRLYVKAIGLYDAMVFDFDGHSHTREEQAIYALYKTIGAILHVHGPERAREFVYTQVIEGYDGILHLTIDF